MSKYDFMKQVEEALKSSGEVYDCIIDSRTYIRNNDVLRYGISISKSNEPVLPTFYVDSYYDDYQRKKITVEETASDILSQLRQLVLPDIGKSGLSLKFSDCRSRIAYRLISAEKNAELLRHTPYVGFLNLAIIFTIVFNNSDAGLETIRITDQLLDSWDVTTDTLLELARENTPRLLPLSIQSLAKVMKDFLQLEGDECLDDEPVIHILSNLSGVYGATSLIYPDVAEDIAKKLGGSYFVLPSSIHEVLIIPDTGEEDVLELSNMVKSVNSEHVRPEEILSDTVYHFDSDSKRFEYKSI